jgi:hypothetical protein
MPEAPNAPQEVPAENRLLPVIRAVGTGVIVLIFWLVDKAIAGRLPAGSVWRYVIGGVIVAGGLVAVLSFSDQLNRKNS